MQKVPKDMKNKIKTEIQILEGIKHDKIISIYDYWDTNDNKIVFITDLMSSGTLKEYY
jgi:serine/threonine protein kinase